MSSLAQEIHFFVDTIPGNVLGAILFFGAAYLADLLVGAVPPTILKTAGSWISLIAEVQWILMALGTLELIFLAVNVYRRLT